MMLFELTDDVVQADPVLMRVIDSNRQFLDAVGWGDAPLVDQYNLATTLELATEADG
ncbi:MAG: hypothetical protein ACYTG0_11020 [Planctomycetota bacterium]|jgi:hypothetical protein